MNHKDLKVLFDTHPKTDEFFITSDGQAFFAKHMADSHGQKLADKTVKSVQRGDLTPVDAFEAGELDTSEDAILEKAEAIKAKRAAVAKIRDAAKAAAAANNAPKEPIKHIITQKDLDENPELVAGGVVVGDVIEVPADDDTANGPVKSPLEIALETPEADRTSYQKGLITKAANEAKKAEGGN